MIYPFIDIINNNVVIIYVYVLSSSYLKLKGSTTIPRGSRAKWSEMVNILTTKIEDKDIV